MNFITLTQYSTESPLYLNADTIVGIYAGDETTSIETTGNFGYIIKETPEEIFKLIAALKTKKRIS